MASITTASRSQSTSGLPNSSLKMTTVDVLDEPVSEEEVIQIYRWLDSLEFSKSRKTTCNRDFADGVIMSELIALYIPKIINPTYCVPSNATSTKISNWEHLNKQVFRRIRFQLTPEIIKDLATARPGMIERVLRKLQPILFLGSKAVVAPSRKLENIKSRFMDFEKSYLKQVDKEKVGQDLTSRPQSRQHSISKPVKGRNTRARTQSRAKGSSIPHAPPSTATLDLKVLKNPTPRSSRLSTKQATLKPQFAIIPEPPMITIHNPNDLMTHGVNYDIFTRPSTGKSSNDGVPSPSELLAEVTNLKTRMDQDRTSAQQEKNKLNDMDDDINLVESSKLPVVLSSWLPVQNGDVPMQLQADALSDIAKGGTGTAGVAGASVVVLLGDGEYSDTDSYSQVSDDTDVKHQKSKKNEEDNKINPSTDTDAFSKLPENRGNPAENPEDKGNDEVDCDQTGYDEDTEEDGEGDGDGAEQDGEVESENFSGRPRREDRKQRKFARASVVKFEYREEYLLNGMAAFKLPNIAQLEKLRNDYINKGNQDPNCRGYGFV